MTSTYAYDHGHPNPPKFFFEVVARHSIGDSITLSSNRNAMTFPDRLDGRLGAGYLVHNSGVSATTLLKNGDFPYWRQPQYEPEPRIEPRYRSDHVAY